MAVEPGELAWALAGGEPPEERGGKALRAALHRLEDLSLVTPIEGRFWVHRFTAEALARRSEAAAFWEACRRAGEAMMERARLTQNVENDKEGARLFLRAEAWERAVEVIRPILDRLQDYGHLWDCAAFVDEIRTGLPKERAELPSLTRRSGDAYLSLNRVQEAQDRYDRALAHSRRLAAAEPQRADYQLDLSASYNKMGNLLWALGDRERARDFYRDALDLRRRLVAVEPQRADYQRDLSVSCNKMGDLLVAQGERKEARHFYQEALALIQKIAAAEPYRSDYQHVWGATYDRLGSLAEALCQDEEARRCYQECIAIARRLRAAEPRRTDYQRELSVSLEKIGDLLVAQNQRKEARDVYMEALEIIQQLTTIEPQRADYQRDLAVSYNRIGDLLRALGEGEDARRCYQLDLEITRRLAVAERQRADYQRDLAVSYNKMRSVDPDNAAAHAANALAILRGLKERGALLLPDEPWLRSLETLVAAGPGRAGV